jgi:hypothetical protein
VQIYHEANFQVDAAASMGTGGAVGCSFFF